jgi:hypothetical protein
MSIGLVVLTASSECAMVFANSARSGKHVVLETLEQGSGKDHSQYLSLQRQKLEPEGDVHVGVLVKSNRAPHDEEWSLSRLFINQYHFHSCTERNQRDDSVGGCLCRCRATLTFVRPDRHARRRWVDKSGVCGNDNIGPVFVRLKSSLQHAGAHLAEGGGGERISCVLVQRFTGVGVAGKRGERSENPTCRIPNHWTHLPASMFSASGNTKLTIGGSCTSDISSTSGTNTR